MLCGHATKYLVNVTEDERGQLEATHVCVRVSPSYAWLTPSRAE